MKDMHNNIKIVHAITPQALGTSAGKTSVTIDRQGYESVEFAFSAGLTASAADLVTPTVLESDTSNASFTSVADADLLGSETALTLDAAKSGQIGYRGSKRYVRIKLVGTGHTSGVVSSVAILGNPALAPVA